MILQRSMSSAAPAGTMHIMLALLLLATTLKASVAMQLPIVQSAVGRPPAKGCDPWDPLKPVAQSLGDPTAFLMLDLLTTHVVPEERKLETPIQFAFVHLMHSSWWDALASFNDTAKPILEAATLPRQSPAKRTIANMNTVLCYTLLRVSEWFLPGAVPGIRSSMVLFQLNPDVVTMDTNTMPGIGNHVADVWIKYALEDGLNRDGSLTRSYNKFNYSDYDPIYVPVNDAFTLRDPTKWQPLMETNELGYFFIQHHITPQIGRAKAFSFSPEEVAALQVEPPYAQELNQELLDTLKNQTDEVLEVSAGLTDKQKITAEWYDDKLVSLAPVAYWLAIMNTWDPHTLLGATLAMNCVYDATVVAWKEKIRHNAVRPMSLVRYFYGNTTIKAYAGRNAGTQALSGNDWRSYLRTMPHAEYPSGTSTVCAAWGEYMRLYLNSDSIEPAVNVFYNKGCSRRESVTPAVRTPFRVSNIDAMIEECGLSRLYAGVHFMPSIKVGAKLGATVGKQCYKKYQSLVK